MDYLKKLLHVKRVLAMVLAVTVIVTSVPTTALAAPADDEQSVTEMTVDETALDDDDTSDEESAVTEEPTDEEVVSEAEDETPDAADQVQPAAAETPNAVTDDVETYADGDDKQEEVEYTIDVSNLKIGATNAYLTETTYDGTGKFVGDGTTPSDSILNQITVKKSDGTSQRLSGVSDINDVFGDDSKVKVTYAWTQGETKLTEAPKNAGKYTLTITLAETGANGKTVTEDVDFEITKAKVTVSFDPTDANLTTVKPGTTVADMQEALKTAGYPLTGDIDNVVFQYILEDTETLVKTNNTISVTGAVVKQAGELDGSKEKELAGTVEFSTNVDYVVFPVIEFAKATDEANFDLVCASVSVNVSDLLTTKVSLEVPDSTAYDKTTPPAVLTDGGSIATTLNTKDGSETVIAVKYDSAKDVTSAVTESLAKTFVATVYEEKEKEANSEEAGDTNEPEYEYISLYEDGKAPVDGKWHVAYYSDYTVTGTEGEGDDAEEVTNSYAYLKIGGEVAAPSEAGIYAYVVTYAGVDGVYASSQACVVVQIGKIDLVVKPAWKSTVKKDSEGNVQFGQESSVSEVLRAVTPEVYELGEVGEDGKAKETKIEPSYGFWGTGFAASGATQPYEPVFEVVQIIDGTQIVVGTNDELEAGATYAVRFTGKKAIYNANGSTYSTKEDINDDEVNSWNDSYQVLVDDATLQGYVAKFEVIEKKVVIDISGITAEGATEGGVLADALANYYAPEAEEEETVDVPPYKILVQTYDGEPLYAKREEYKKAKLNDESGNPVPGVNPEDFTYTWFALTPPDDDFITVDDVVIDENEGDEEKEPNYVLKDGGADFIPINCWETGFNNTNITYNAVSPYNSGIYMLLISYTDPNKEQVAENAAVYFVIEQQELTLKLINEDPYAPYANYEATASTFLSNIYADLKFEVTPEEAYKGKPSGGDNSQWKRDTELVSSEWNYNFIYDVPQSSLKLQKQSTERDEEGNTKWDDVADYDVLNVSDADNIYRVVVDEFRLGNYWYRFSGYENWPYTDSVYDYRNYELIVDEEHNSADVTVKEMGTTNLSVGESEETFEATREYNGDSILDMIPTEKIEEFSTVYTYTETAAEGGDPERTYTPVDPAVLAEKGVSVTYTVVYSYQGTPRVTRAYDHFPTADDLKWAKNGGVYTIGASAFEGNDDYAPMPAQLLAQLTITQKEIQLTPPTPLQVTVGDSATSVTNKALTEFWKSESLVVTGIVDADKGLFTKTYVNGYQTYLAWCSYTDTTETYGYTINRPSFAVYKGKQEWNSALTELGTETYTLRVKAGNLQGLAARNYTVVTPGEGVGSIEVIRAHSTVESVNDEHGESYASIDEIESIDNVTYDNATGFWSHKFETLATVPWDTYLYRSLGIVGEDGKGIEGNWIEVKITAPYGYTNARVLNNDVTARAITNAGGTIVQKSQSEIHVVFNYAELDENPKFNIRWDDEYIEHFELVIDRSKLEVNLEYAVAPKSLAFNSPKKSMVVGEVQRLDVKVTKQQISDIICLGYDVTAGKDVLHIDDYGQVTALSKGTATVEVYAMHMVNGVKVKFEGKEAKKATVKITVKDVAARKISKVTASDTGATVRYAFVDETNALGTYENGYRREIYVLEGKNVNAAQFEAKIGEMKNEQWQGIFAAAPIFAIYSNEASSNQSATIHKVWDAKAKKYLNFVDVKLSNLDANTQYTVYVRNVSAVRTLGDGCRVADSHVGSVKTFKTTAPRVNSISATLKDDGAWYSHRVYDNNYHYYAVNLAKGTAQIEVTGTFDAKVLDDAADDGDTITRALPLTNKAEQKKYAAPKLSYSWYLYDSDDETYLDTEQRKSRGLSDVVTIAKNGKITLKQPTMGSRYNEIWIRVEDTVSGETADLDIYIRAIPTSVKGKNTSLTAGQSKELYELVEYKEGKKTLSQTYFDASGRIDDDNFTMTPASSDAIKVIDGSVYAYGKGSVTLKLKDLVSGDEPTVKVNASDLAAVKSLSVTNVIDQRATVQFEKNEYATAYRIDVLDGRGKLVKSVYVANNNATDETDWYTKSVFYGWNDNWYSHTVGTGKKAKTYLTYRFTDLKQQSKYTVKVTTYFQRENGINENDNNMVVTSKKVASKAFTTTKMPAANTPLRLTGTGNSGLTTYVKNQTNGSTGDVESYIYVSGNTYTLTATPMNRAAQWAATDSLTWTSTNKKVATVKANSGSYNATLKAVKNGTTTIEVKSKILKQVIARYTITVRTVGDAYSGRPYYGDEDLRKGEVNNGGDIKEVTLGVPVMIELNQQSTTTAMPTYRFVAPENGDYRWVRREPNGTVNYTSITGAQKGVSYDYAKNTGYVGHTLWVEPVLTSNKNVTKLELNETYKHAANTQWFVFTAPAEGYYKFADSNINVNTANADGTQGDQLSALGNMYKLAANQTVYIVTTISNNTVYARQVDVKELKDSTATAPFWPKYGEAEAVCFIFKPANKDRYDFEVKSDKAFDVHVYVDETTGNRIEGLNPYNYSPDEDGVTYSSKVTSNNELDPEKEYLIKVTTWYSDRYNDSFVTLKASPNTVPTTGN